MGRMITNHSGRHDIASKLRNVMGRFPRGLSLNRDDLALLAWLYLYEETRGDQGISESELRWLISEASEQLHLDSGSLHPAQVVQRFMRYNLLRVAFTESSSQGYRLTCFGQGMAKNLVEETDYSSEQLDVLLGYALFAVKSAQQDGDETLLKYLNFVFLSTIREKVEYKLLSMEEDLLERKREVRRTYAGQNETDFESALESIGHCRLALTELVDAIQESSACAMLEDFLHECMSLDPIPDLYDALEESADFLYSLRSRIGVMLKDVVLFIRDCVAFRTLAFTVDSRDRLCRIQERIISHALTGDIRIPVLSMPRISRIDLSWSNLGRERPVHLDVNRLKTLDNYLPPQLPPVEPAWKAPLLEMARDEWQIQVGNGGVELGEWLNKMMIKLPQLTENISLAVWFLIQDWPEWSPGVSVEQQHGIWVPLGKEWVMEAIRLVPAENGEF
jgi:hypothetical protein